MQVKGKCHCGNISFTLQDHRFPEQIPARACDCSFCLKHSGVWTSIPTASLRVQVKVADQVQHYFFGSRTACFHICKQCGVVPLATSEIDQRQYAVVSVNAFEEFDPARLSRGPISFEGEALESRLARRKRSWIGNVRIENG